MRGLEPILSSGQTESQVVASRGKLNLRRDLHWGRAERTGKFPQKYTQVAKKTFQGRNILYFIANNTLMDVTQLALTWVGWPNGDETCVDLRAKLISTKVSASQRKRTQALAKRSRK